LIPDVKLRKPQIDAIWRVVTNLRTMLAHEVGAGKTWIGIVALHEAKRLGMIKKPYLVVPRNTVVQWKMAWNRLYPTDSILVQTRTTLASIIDNALWLWPPKVIGMLSLYELS